jgi:hypothetical protein
MAAHFAEVRRVVAWTQPPQRGTCVMPEGERPRR